MLFLNVMDPYLRKYDSLAEADDADQQYYASLQPEECLEILLDLIQSNRDSYSEAAERFERVYRVDELSRR